MSEYVRDQDKLYDASIFANEFLRLRDIIGQLIYTMNENGVWGAANGIPFQGHRVIMGSAKGDHDWWASKISNKQNIEARFSEIDCPVKKIDPSLLMHILFSQRQNLHFREVLDDNGNIQMSAGIDEDGNFLPANQDENDRVVMEIGWIIDPVEFLCASIPPIFNGLNNKIVLGENDNFGRLLRGATGSLFYDIVRDVHQVMLIKYSATLGNFDNHPRKPLSRSVKYLGHEI